MNRLHTYLLTRARIQRRQHVRVHRRQVLRTTGWGMAAIAAVAMIGVILLLTWQYSRLTFDLPSIEQIPQQLNAQSVIFTKPTRLIDRSGTQVLLDLTTPGVQRKYMRIAGVGDRVSADFVNAIIAITEPGYHTSSGVDLLNLNPEEHRTIAQKLVFDMLLSQEPSTSRRAIRERILAAQIISRYGRDRVLEWYINSLPFGHLAYGVEAGAQTYFGKASSAINLPEAATLAGVALAPAINPWDSKAGAETLKQEVLKIMTLQGVITPAVFNAAIRGTVDIAPITLQPEGSVPTFNRKVQKQLEQTLGKAHLERGGLTVQTTLDQTLQGELVCIIQTQLSALEGKSPDLIQQSKLCPASRLLPLLPPGETFTPGRIASSAMVADPQTGEILAMTGEISTTGISPVLQPHAIGSLVTPFVYINGFAQGYSPATLVWDAPDSSQPAISNISGNPDQFHGPVSIRTALANDYLQPAVWMIRQLGWNSFLRLTRSMGLSFHQTEEASELLQQQVTLTDVIRAYSVLAGSGIRAGVKDGSEEYPSLNSILKVWDENGNLILDRTTPDSVSVVSAPLVYLVNQPLSDDIARRPSMGFPNVLQLGTPTSAKIGMNLTKNESWTVGYTSDRVVGVWLGARESSPPDPVVIDYRWTAGIWRAVMDRSMSEVTPKPLTPPPGVTTLKVCDPSGYLPTEDCPITAEEIFISGLEPTTPDTLYHRLTINRETGRLATVFTAPELTQDKVFLDVPTEFIPWAKNAGLNISPTEYDIIQSGVEDPAVHFSSPQMYSYVHGKVELTGTASSQDFSVYRIQIGEGLNPRTWQQIGQDGRTPVIEGLLGELDTTGLNGLYVLRMQVIDTQNRIKSAYLQLTVDNELPKVKIAYPGADQIIDASSSPVILIRVDASDNVGMERVEIWLDGKKLTELSTIPYAIPWDVLSGKHVLQAIGYDSVGNKSIGSDISFTVQ